MSTIIACGTLPLCFCRIWSITACPPLSLSPHLCQSNNQLVTIRFIFTSLPPLPQPPSTCQGSPACSAFELAMPSPLCTCTKCWSLGRIPDHSFSISSMAGLFQENALPHHATWLWSTEPGLGKEAEEIFVSVDHSSKEKTAVHLLSVNSKTFSRVPLPWQQNPTMPRSKLLLKAHGTDQVNSAAGKKFQEERQGTKVKSHAGLLCCIFLLGMQGIWDMARRGKWRTCLQGAKGRVHLVQDQLDVYRDARPGKEYWGGRAWKV